MIMKVRYTLPVRGLLRVYDHEPLRLYEWLFDFIANEETGYIDSLAIEISNIPRDRWPTFSDVKQDLAKKIPEFPLELNKNAFSFREIEPNIINLESYLSVFGLESIELVNIKEEWICESEDEENSCMWKIFSISREKPKIRNDPLTQEQLARCIVASSCSENDTAVLAHFRVGKVHFLSGRFIESIRHFYMSLEYKFAHGKFRKNAVLDEFSQSDELNRVVSKVFFEEFNESFEILKHKWSILKNAKHSKDFLRFLVELRGDIQHTSQYSLKKWHPSREHEFEHEAICVINVVEEICFEMTSRKIMLVPVDNYTNASPGA
jgi:hypothetical protein